MIRPMRALGALLLLFTVSAHAADWRVDPAGSKLTFKSSYQGQAAPGEFKKFDTQMRFDPAKPAGSQLDVTVKLDSFDMGSSEINDAIREPDWFDLKRFPTGEFHSTDIRQAAPGRYVARGTLRLKGMQQPLELPFTWKDGGKTAQMAGEIKLNRTSFGIGTGEWKSGDVIGLDVIVDFDVRLQRIK